MKIKVFSRTNEANMPCFVYNGSFSEDNGDILLDASDETKEAWAKMLDCFHEVIFVTEGPAGLIPHAITYIRTWG